MISWKEAAVALEIPDTKLLLLIKLGVILPIVSRNKGPILFGPKEIDRAKHAIADMTFLATVQPGNWDLLKQEKLSFTAFPESPKGWHEVLRSGNRILFYVTRLGAVAGLASVTGKVRREPFSTGSTTYPLRVRLKPEIILDPTSAVKIKPLRERLSFIKNPKNWSNYVKFSLTPVSRQDFNLIHGHMTANLAAQSTTQ